MQSIGIYCVLTVCRSPLTVFPSKIIVSNAPTPPDSGKRNSAPKCADSGGEFAARFNNNAPPKLPGRGTAIFLGTGTSVGVPAIGCVCDVCTSEDPRNNRLRCAILVDLPKGLLLIDSPPDLRTQLLRERVRTIDAVLYTHEHADHIFGVDDLRLFPFRLGHAVPLYCQEKVEDRIRLSFDYAFIDRKETHPGSRPQLEFQRIGHDPFELLGARITPIPMKHGPHFEVLGFRIGDFAYCTDTNEIPDASIDLLQGVKTLVVGALREKPHATHFNLEQATEIAQAIRPQQTYFTHVCHDLDHQRTCDYLPAGVDLAHDGLRVSVKL